MQPILPTIQPWVHYLLNFNNEINHDNQGSAEWLSGLRCQLLSDVRDGGGLNSIATEICYLSLFEEFLPVDTNKLIPFHEFLVWSSACDIPKGRQVGYKWIIMLEKCGPRYQYFSHQMFFSQMNNRQSWQLKKSNSWGPFWSFQLDSSANPAHLPQKWAELAVLFSW